MQLENVFLFYGSCHCEAVKFSIRYTAPVRGIECNCSICHTSGFFNYMVSVMKRMYHNFLQLFRDFFGGGSASAEPILNHNNLLNRLNDINCNINLKTAIIKTFSLQLQDIEKKDRKDPAAICEIDNLQNDIDLLIRGQNVDDVINRAIQYLEERSKQTYTSKTTWIISKIYYKQSEQDLLSNLCKSLKAFKF